MRGRGGGRLANVAPFSTSAPARRENKRFLKEQPVTSPFSLQAARRVEKVWLSWQRDWSLGVPGRQHLCPRCKTNRGASAALHGFLLPILSPLLPSAPPLVTTTGGLQASSPPPIRVGFSIIRFLSAARLSSACASVSAQRLRHGHKAGHGEKAGRSRKGRRMHTDRGGRRRGKDMEGDMVVSERGTLYPACLGAGGGSFFSVLRALMSLVTTLIGCIRQGRREDASALGLLCH